MPASTDTATQYVIFLIILINRARNHTNYDSEWVAVSRGISLAVNITDFVIFS